MRYLVDTCVISEITRPRPHSAVIEWLNSQDANDLHVSVLAFAELEKGVARLPASRKKERLERWLQDDIKKRFADHLFDVNLGIAELWGRIQAEAERRGKPLPVIDGLVAATAIANDCVVVTRNVADFERAGARTVNPWSA